jgi:hypothetical protein
MRAGLRTMDRARLPDGRAHPAIPGHQVSPLRSWQADLNGERLHCIVPAQIFTRHSRLCILCLSSAWRQGYHYQRVVARALWERPGTMVAARLIIAVVILSLGTPACGEADRVALVIGNGRYLHTPRLANPASDASELSKLLRTIGFDVLQFTDLDRITMDRAIRAFMSQAAAARIALLFYAGHGMQLEGRNYLVPVDAALGSPSSIENEMIEIDALLPDFGAAHRASILMLDACRDNPLAQKLKAQLEPSQPSRSATIQMGLAPFAALGPGGSETGTGMLIAFATAPGTVALDGAGRNSPFTTALLKHIISPGLEIRQMLTRPRIRRIFFSLGVARLAQNIICGRTSATKPMMAGIAMPLGALTADDMAHLAMPS